MKALKLFYIALIHILILVLFFFPDFYTRIEAKVGNVIHTQKVDYFRAATATMLARQEANSSADTVYFIGDSTVQGLNTARLGKTVLNLGIGHDKTADVLNRVANYANVAKAKQLNILVGINDLNNNSLAQTKDNYRNLMVRLSAVAKVNFHAVLPVDTELWGTDKQRDIDQLNRFIQTETLKFPQFSFIPSPAALSAADKGLKPNYHIGDGLHLNSDGYEVLINHLKGKLQ